MRRVSCDQRGKTVGTHADVLALPNEFGDNMDWAITPSCLARLNPVEFRCISSPFPAASFATRRGPVDVIKVSAGSRTSSVAGAIAGVVREHKRAEVQAIGAGAVNQAIKATAIARGYLQEDGIDVICIPEFTSVDIEGKERTAIRLVVEPR